MKKLLAMLLIGLFLVSCASNVKFVQTDDTFEPEERPSSAPLVYTEDEIERPHKVVGVISAELGKGARKPELDALIKEKALELGVDGVMLVEYDVDKDVYVDSHHGIVGRGPWRRHVVTKTPHVKVKKTASGIAVIFVD
ncbi:hypothetical protein JXI42_04335 [bacterium]|nr:hypothetical protein [bacterium]